MKKYYLTSIFQRFNVALAILLTALFIHSCKKDNSSTTAPKLDPVLAQAKSWYESAYPINNDASGSLVTHATGGSVDLSQHIKPDWQHSTSYKSSDKNVIELPIDPSIKFGSDLKNITANRASNRSYTRSSFLLLNDGKKYDAYIMTIIADSSYVKNDTSKLRHNTYRQHDADFSGLVLYFTPKGRYLSGYRYKDGQLVVPSTAQSGDSKKVQSIANNQLKPADMVCIDWYWQTYVDGVLVSEEYLYTTCSGNSGGTGGSGGDSGTPPPPCTTAPPQVETSVSGSHLTVNTLHPFNFPLPGDPCDENASHPQDPDFGEDDPTQCLNCRITNDNFADYLQYEQANGNTVFYPYPSTFTYNGVAYSGMVTEVDDANGNVLYSYFTPDADSSVFQTETQYKIGTNNATPSVVYGTLSYFGSTTGSFSRPTGTGGGGRNANTTPSKIILIENPSSVDWSNEPDNVTLTDPNPVTYAQYQSTTPWPTIANIIPFSQFVPYRKNANGIGVNCLTLSKEQLAKVGYTCSGYLPGSQTFQTYTSASAVNLVVTKQAITYVIGSLTSHIPVIAGVDSYPGTSSNFDGITDHFITIDGMGTDSNGKYFHFVDNSTADPSAGDYYNNRLYYNETTGKISGKCNTTYTTHDYIVTQIRKSIKKPDPPQ